MNNPGQKDCFVRRGRRRVENVQDHSKTCKSDMLFILISFKVITCEEFSFYFQSAFVQELFFCTLFQQCGVVTQPVRCCHQWFYIEPEISKVDGLLVVLHTQPLNLGGLIQISSIRGLKMLCAICKHGSSRWSESTI